MRDGNLDREAADLRRWMLEDDRGAPMSTTAAALVMGFCVFGVVLVAVAVHAARALGWLA